MADKTKKTKKTPTQALPLPNGFNGRTNKGTFTKGNSASKGHKAPYAKNSLTLRKVLLDVCTEDKIKSMVLAQVLQACKGNTTAFCELMDRCFGKAPQVIGLIGGGEDLENNWKKLTPAERMQALQESMNH